MKRHASPAERLARMRKPFVPRHAEINENLARKILRKAATPKENAS